jgi:predicted regulator of Ras-like GTPase activity (Roadblock/LC7/MglB family)
MAIQGNLQDMSVADLIQSYCQDQKTAQIMVRQNGRLVELYVHDGQVVHAAGEGLEGEEAVYQALGWQEGEFSLETGMKSPRKSIKRNWPGLLLEGAKRLDEAAVTAVQDIQEKPTMSTKRKSEILADTITDFLSESTDVYGAAVVGVDGLVYSANVPQKDIDETIVGGAAAAIYGLSKRGADQLHKGAFKQTLIQGDDGNIIIHPLNSDTLLIALTQANVNLGMAFAETRSAAGRLRGIL